MNGGTITAERPPPDAEAAPARRATTDTTLSPSTTQDEVNRTAVSAVAWAEHGRRRNLAELRALVSGRKRICDLREAS